MTLFLIKLVEIVIAWYIFTRITYLKKWEVVLCIVMTSIFLW